MLILMKCHLRWLQHQCFKKGFLECKPCLLEPIYEVEVKVPDEYMGDVMGDISSKRGKILGMDSDGHFQIIKAHVPLSELYKYSSQFEKFNSRTRSSQT